MIRKKTQHERAKELRRRGFTYEEIAKIVDVSKSTVGLWFSRETWSKDVTHTNQKRASRENSKRISLLNKARSNQFKKLYAEAERSAKTEFKHYKHNPLFIAGLTLYLCDGDKINPHLIRIASKRVDIHRIFIRFAYEYLGVSREKVRFWLLLPEDLNPLSCSRHWSQKLKIPITQFHRYQIINGKSSTEALRFGVGNTIIGSTVLKKKLLTWIELALKEL